MTSSAELVERALVRRIRNLEDADAHRWRLTQVFMNLIENALTHHDHSTGSTEVGAERRAGLWEFLVRDDGPGIPPESHDWVVQAARCRR